MFKLNKDGSGYAILRSFRFIGDDGKFPRAALLEGSDGALYGTTVSGGSRGDGTVFKLNKSGGSYAVLQSFSSTGGDGEIPLNHGLFGGRDRGAGGLAGGFRLLSGLRGRLCHCFA